MVDVHENRLEPERNSGREFAEGVIRHRQSLTVVEELQVHPEG